MIVVINLFFGVMTSSSYYLNNYNTYFTLSPKTSLNFTGKLAVAAASSAESIIGLESSYAGSFLYGVAFDAKGIYRKFRRLQRDKITEW